MFTIIYHTILVLKYFICEIRVVNGTYIKNKVRPTLCENQNKVSHELFGVLVGQPTISMV